MRKSLIAALLLLVTLASSAGGPITIGGPRVFAEPPDPPPGDTALAEAAASLSANQSLLFGTVPSGVIAPDSAPSTMYSSSGVYDAANKQLLYVGRRNSSDFAYRLLTYDEATDTWSNGTMHSGATVPNGHGYDHTAFDPATGNLYHRPFNDLDVFVRSSSGTWSNATTMPSKFGDAATITWFPGVGLIWTDCQVIRKLPTSNGTWTTIASGFSGVSNNHIVSEWNATANVIIFGSGNCFNTMRKMTSSETVTTIATPPFSVSSSELDGLLNSVPNEDRFIGWEKTTDNWTIYDVSDDAWTDLTQSTGSGASPQTGTPNIDGFTHCVGYTVEAYDVLVYVCGNSTNAGEVWLYKH